MFCITDIPAMEGKIYSDVQKYLNKLDQMGLCFTSTNLHQIDEQETILARLTVPISTYISTQLAKTINYIALMQTTQATNRNWREEFTLKR